MKYIIIIIAMCFNLAHAQNKFTFDKVPVTELVKVIYTDVLKKPFVMSPSASTKTDVVTMSFESGKNAPVVKMLEMTLQSSGLKIIKNGDVDFIDINETVLDAKSTYIYTMQHRSADYAQALLSPFFEKLASVKSNDSAVSSHLAFEGTASQIKDLKKAISILDIPESQADVRAVVYQYTSDDRASAGIQAIGEILGGTFSASIGPAPTGNFLKISLGKLDGVISALAGDSRFSLISKPFVRVTDGKKAKFTSGDETPILSGQKTDDRGNVTQNIEYKPSGVILEVKPTIRESSISIDVNQTLSNFQPTNNGVSNSPTLSKREVSTSLQLASGDVIAIGGLTDDKTNSDRSTLLGFPVGKSNSKTNSELLILLQVTKI